jgi:hypothetical protein
MPQPDSAPVVAVSLAPSPPVSLRGQLPPAPPVVSVKSYVPSYRLSGEVYTILGGKVDRWRIFLTHSDGAAPLIEAHMTIVIDQFV